MHFKIICFFMALECNGVFCIGLRSLILEAHNRRRAKYGNQPLVLDEKLSEECKKYAQLRMEKDVQMSIRRTKCIRMNCMDWAQLMATIRKTSAFSMMLNPGPAFEIGSIIAAIVIIENITNLRP
ncbi:uncharacterized protein [Drosophila takahashii]|uniref:uncharacterized protein isoform X2 n=1 Tax=Drosophila takahashii TaxID=29030 RepID=UPI0038994476